MPSALRASILILFSLGAFAQDNVLSTAQWNKDIDYAVRMIKTRHANPFHSLSKNDLDLAVYQLKEKARALEPYQFRLELEKLGASIGDGHTWISDRFKKDPYLIYPLYLRWFSDGLYVIGIQKDHLELLGSRLSAIDGTPVSDAVAKVGDFIPGQENKYYVQYWEGYWFRNSDALYYNGVSKSRERASFTIETPSGDKKTAILEASSQAEPDKTIAWAYDPPPGFMMRSQEAIWFQALKPSKAFYIKVNRYPDKGEMKSISKKILEGLSAEHPGKIIFDFRMNGGGDKTRIEFLVDDMVKAGWAGKARFFAITGDHSFSAALANAVYLREKTGALIVGEPPTNRPDFYSENLFLELPQSKISVSISTMQNHFGNEGDQELTLDRYFPRQYADYAKGLDPVMRWILEQ